MIDSLSDFGQIFPEEYLFKEYQQDISVVKEIMFSNLNFERTRTNQLNKGDQIRLYCRDLHENIKFTYKHYIKTENRLKINSWGKLYRVESIERIKPKSGSQKHQYVYIVKIKDENNEEITLKCSGQTPFMKKIIA